MTLSIIYTNRPGKLPPSLSLYIHIPSARELIFWEKTDAPAISISDGRATKPHYHHLLIAKLPLLAKKKTRIVGKTEAKKEWERESLLPALSLPLSSSRKRRGESSATLPALAGEFARKPLWKGSRAPVVCVCVCVYIRTRSPLAQVSEEREREKRKNCIRESARGWWAINGRVTPRRPAGFLEPSSSSLIRRHRGSYTFEWGPLWGLNACIYKKAHDIRFYCHFAVLSSSSRPA